MNLDKNISKRLLFAPPLAFMFFNFLSAYYINSVGVYNGDFQGIPTTHSPIMVWFFAFLSSTPFLIIYLLVLKTTPVNKKPIKLPKLFVYFALFILGLSLFFTLFLGVGMMGKSIYSAPSFVKPLIVLINRIDPVILTGILMLSPEIKNKFVIPAALLLLAVTLARGSLQYVPFVLMLSYYRLSIRSDTKMKYKKNKASRNNIILILAVLLVIYFAPDLYKFREGIREAEAIAINSSFFEFLFGKLIGRLSNLSAFLMFEGRYNLLYQRIDEIQTFSFFLDATKYFWGGFIKTPIMNHYDYFTSIYDPDAYGYYAMQTGVIPALGISLTKSFVVFLVDCLIIFLSVYFTVKLSTIFLGFYGKYLAICLLSFATLSGAPNQFSLPVFHLMLMCLVVSFFQFVLSRRDTAK